MIENAAYLKILPYELHDIVISHICQDYLRVAENILTNWLDPGKDNYNLINIALSEQGLKTHINENVQG